MVSEKRKGMAGGWLNAEGCGKVVSEMSKVVARWLVKCGRVWHGVS